MVKQKEQELKRKLKIKKSIKDLNPARDYRFDDFDKYFAILKRQHLDFFDENQITSKANIKAYV